MTPEEVTALFTRSSGDYVFARWARPIAPVVFGVEDETLEVIKGALEALVGMAGHSLTEMDPEMGSNLMLFFFRDWAELLDVPDLDQMVPDLADLVARLQSEGANQYRGFRFDADGSIRAAFVFLRMDAGLEAMPADALALSQVLRVLLLWSDQAFVERSVLARVAGRDCDGEAGLVVHPDIADVVRAAYDPVLPVVADDASHALRVFARMGPGGARKPAVIGTTGAENF